MDDQLLCARFSSNSLRKSDISRISDREDSETEHSRESLRDTGMHVGGGIREDLFRKVYVRIRKIPDISTINSWQINSKGDKVLIADE